MKKSLLFALAAVAMLGACNNAEKAEESKGEATASDLTEVRTVECVASGDVVYVHIDSVYNQSKLYAKEGEELNKKVEDYQQRLVAAQQSWSQREQSIANEYNKLQRDAAKLQEDYQKGLITTLNAQQKGEELAGKEQSIQTRMNSLQSTVQSEGQALATEEQTLAEEQMVLMNRYTTLLKQAISEINADGCYKMIVDGMTVIDADPTLNISSLVLQKVDELYVGGALD